MYDFYVHNIRLIKVVEDIPLEQIKYITSQKVSVTRLQFMDVYHIQTNVQGSGY